MNRAFCFGFAAILFCLVPFHAAHAGHIACFDGVHHFKLSPDSTEFSVQALHGARASNYEVEITGTRGEWEGTWKDYMPPRVYLQEKNPDSSGFTKLTVSRAAVRDDDACYSIDTDGTAEKID